MQFMMERDLKDVAFSNGNCALTRPITDQRFFAGSLPGPDGDVYVTVQTYQLADIGYCKALNARTVAVVHLLEPRPRDRKMTTVSAGEMATSIAATGRIALYGILFDTDKADLKPASDPALMEISTLLKNDPRLAVLVVGHTDSQGAFESNMDLSKRRADSVVRALTATYKIDPKRLRAAGAGMIAPTAPNDTDDGRAKNRRVEIVKLN
jgi:outer membrane protein OmpA-like peptidoglycan-associated protein